MPLESLPLAAGYLKATVLSDPALRNHIDIDIRNFRGGATHVQMAHELFHREVPDLLALSVFGWNLRAFGSLAATFKQLNPAGLVVVGGTHVTDQADRVFRLYPDIDVVVNGEGELTFQELVRTWLSGASAHELADVAGLSWRTADGTVVTNPARPRIEDLDTIPSPFLTGAVELTDQAGVFRYDVALLETNRGCPYKCAFCYWGGAVGQRVRAFSRARLREELELFAKLQVHTVVACDANFGMLPIDEELVEDLVDIRQRYGFPRAFESSWAKNKSQTFYRIVRRMKDAGLRSSFTLALQSLAPAAIETMNRRNMKVNEWQDLARWLTNEGLDCYAELIWGLPGESVESFLRGYDELSRWVSRIAVYPMMLLPNTEYLTHKDRYGIVSVHGDADDFEYVLAHREMSFDDNARIQRFLFWARVLAENAVLRHVWAALRELAGISQTAVLDSFSDWVDKSTGPGAAPLRAAVARVQGGGAPAYAVAIAYLFTRPEGNEVLRRWWAEAVRPRLGTDVRPLLDEIFRYDLLTKPVCPPGDPGHPGNPEDAGLPVVERAGNRYYLRSGVVLSHDVPMALADLRAGRRPSLAPRRTVVSLYYRTGALNAVLSTNHEEIMHFMGCPDVDVTPLSFSEEAAWEEFRTDPQTFFSRRGAFAADVPAGVDDARVPEVVERVCARHEILRTAFEPGAGRPVRRVLPGYQHAVTVADEVGEPGVGRSATRLAPEDLVGIWLTPGPAGGRRLTFGLNEMITDPWSCARLRAEVTALLDGEPILEPLPGSYSGYACEERERELSADLAGYWRAQLVGIGEASGGLAPDGPDPSGDPAGELVQVLPDDLTEAVREVCRRHRASPFMAVTAVVTMTLATMSGARDILLATAASTRPKQWMDVHGNFSNVALLRTALPPDPAFTEVVRRSKTTVLGALQNQPMPYLRLREVVPTGALPRPAVRVHYLAARAHHFGATLDAKPSGAAWREEADVPSWPLDLGFAEDGRRRVAIWTSYDARLYRHTTVELLIQRCGQVLGMVASDPDLTCDELSRRALPPFLEGAR